MQIGTIVRPNVKGQVVIPKQIRIALSIDKNSNLNLVIRDHAIHMYPVVDIGVKTLNKSVFLKILKETRGAWRHPIKQEIEKAGKRREVELAATRRNKKAW